MIEINKNYNESNLETMAKMPDCFVDLTVTSPPYDDLRIYNGFEFDWQKVIKELYRVTKKGGVVVWIVSDATIKASETGTSFRQALYAMDCGFKLHDTMIWNKGGFTAVGALKTRYAQVFEYMFVFVKGILKTFNPLKDRLNKKQTGTFLKNKRLADGTMGEVGKYGQRNKYGQRFNIWELANTDRSEHPAIFPRQLIKDHIVSWSNEGDLVYDCFMGSGTVAEVCINNDRDWIGSEISSEYCDIIEERVKKAREEKKSNKSEKALRIGIGSGSFLVKKLQWEVVQDEVFGELVIAKVPLPSNNGRARYEIKSNNYDNEPKRYYVTLFCGNQGHRCCDELWINTKEAAKEYAQGHFRMLIENCLQNE